MRILGIETSCDETSAAVVEETGDAARPWIDRARTSSRRRCRSIASGAAWCPSSPSRQHIRDICGVVERALEEAGAGWSDLGAVAVTQGPGLVGSLLVGVAFAKAAAAAAGLPLVAVHHLAGHIESLVLEHGELPLPAVVLVVSGGHTSLYLVERAGALPACSAGRATMRRARRTTRWPSCSASDIPAGRSSTRWRAAGTTARCRCRRRG